MNYVGLLEHLDNLIYTWGLKDDNENPVGTIGELYSRHAVKILVLQVLEALPNFHSVAHYICRKYQVEMPATELDADHLVSFYTALKWSGSTLNQKQEAVVKTLIREVFESLFTDQSTTESTIDLYKLADRMARERTDEAGLALAKIIRDNTFAITSTNDSEFEVHTLKWVLK